MQVATGGCSMQRRPALTVSGINVSSSLQELLHHLLEVIYAALQTSTLSGLSPSQPLTTPPHHPQADLVQCCQAILIGQIRADPVPEELADCKKWEVRLGQGL